MVSQLRRLNALTCASGVMKDCLSKGRYVRALEIYDKIPVADRDDKSSLFAIKACIQTKNFQKGIEIHHDLQRSHSKLQNVYLQSALINLYGEQSDIDNALDIFNQIPSSKRDAVIITSMMNAHLQCGQYQEALDLYDNDSVSKPTANKKVGKPIGHLLALKTCTKLRDLDRGRQIHALLKERDLYNNEFIKTELIHFYGHCGDIQSAENVFYSDGSQHGVICIGSMMTAYNLNQKYVETLDLFQSTLRRRPEIKQNDTALSQAIKACTATMDIQIGHEIAKYIHTMKEMKNDERLHTALIQFYGNIGEIQMAIDVFNAIPITKWDVFMVDVMMDTLCDNERYFECLEVFNKMESADHLVPDVLTIINVFRACCAETVFYFGQRVHDRMKNEKIGRSLLKHKEVQSALIAFYGKCGVLERCEEIFENIKRNEMDKYLKEISIWNAMLTAHGRNGNIERVKELYDSMTKQMGLVPDTQTYIAMISAFCNVGDMENAQRIWSEEIEDEKMKYDEYVMTVLLDGMAKKGMLKETMTLILRYHADCKVMWMSLLSAAHLHSDITVVESVYQQILRRFQDDDKFMSSVTVVMTKALAK